MSTIEKPERPGEKKFRIELEKAIRELMRRDVDPTPDNLFDYIRTHPGDFPMISRLRLCGMEDHLRIYLYLHGRLRDRMKATKVTE